MKALVLLATVLAALSLPALAVDTPWASTLERYEIRPSVGLSFTGATITVLVGHANRDAHCVGATDVMLSYNDPGNWDAIAVPFNRVKIIYDLVADPTGATFVETDLGNFETHCPLEDLGSWGPTESSVAIPIPLQEFGVPVTLELGTTLKYAVFVEGGRDVLGNQDATIEALKIGTGSTFRLMSAHPMTIRGTVTNNGVLQKYEGEGTYSIATPLVNKGQVESVAGTLRILGGVSGEGSFDANGGNIELLNVTHTLDAEHLLTYAGGSIVLGGGTQMTLRPGNVFNFGSIVLMPQTWPPPSLVMGDGEVTFLGGGIVVMAPSASGCGRIAGTSAASRLNVYDCTTIRGAGIIGGGGLVVDNRGVIDANAVGYRLCLVPSGTIWENTGTMQASGGGILRLEGGTFNNAGVIQAMAGSTVELVGATITGGTVRNDAPTAWITVTGHAGSAVTARLDNSVGGQVLVSDDYDYTWLTLGGGLTNGAGGVVKAVGYGRFLTDGGEVENHGAIILEPGWVGSGWGGGWQVGGEVRLTGDGAVRLLASNYGSSWIQGAGNGSRLVNVDNTIQGAGILGRGGLVLVNQGTVRADVGGAVLTLDAEGRTWENAGTLEATSGAILRLYNGTFINGGLLRAAGGGCVEVEADVTGPGSWQAEGGTFHISGGSVSVAERIDMTGGGRLEVAGGALSVRDLVLTSEGSLWADALVSVGRRVAIETQDEAAWAWASNGVLQMTGGQGAAEGQWMFWAPLEAGGQDFGNVAQGYSGNFDLERLEIAAGARVVLVDDFSSGNRFDHGFGHNEALYVDYLYLRAGAELNLNGLHLYYHNLSGDPGQIIDSPIPEPATLSLLALGGLAMIRRRRT